MCLRSIASFYQISLIGVLFMTACQTEQEGTKAQYRDITTAVYSTVTVEPQQSYTVFAPVSGIIEYSLLEEGKLVRKGEQLFQVNNRQSDFNQANAQLNFEIARETYSGEATILKELEENIQSAQIKLLNDSLNYERQARLWAQNVGSLQAYEARKLSYELAVNELNRLKNTYMRTQKELARKMQLAQNTLAISAINRQEFTISSKMDGTIYEVYKEEGEAVSPQTPVALLGSTDSFILKMLIDEVDIASVFIGQATLVTLDAYGNQTFPATIQRIYPTKDERSQTFSVEASFDRSPERLFNGLSGEANIIISQRSAVLSLPKQLIQEDQTVLTDEGYVKVVSGVSDLQFVEIISGIDSTTIIYQPE